MLIFNCSGCNKTYEKSFNKDLTERFASPFKFCNGYIKKFCLMLRKGVHPCEYMNISERFNETSLLDKKGFYSSLNMENIADADYKHGKRVYKDFKKSRQVSWFVSSKQHSCFMRDFSKKYDMFKDI